METGLPGEGVYRKNRCINLLAMNKKDEGCREIPQKNQKTGVLKGSDGGGKHLSTGRGERETAKTVSKTWGGEG